MPSARRFPPPWTIDEKDACFIVRDKNGQATANLLTKDEARRMAVNFAKLPELLPKP